MSANLAIHGSQVFPESVKQLSAYRIRSATFCWSQALELCIP